MLTTACIHEKQLNFPVMHCLVCPGRAACCTGRSGRRLVPRQHRTRCASRQSHHRLEQEQRARHHVRCVCTASCTRLRVLRREREPIRETAADYSASDGQLSAQETRAATCTCWASRNWRVLSSRSNASFEPIPPRYHWSRADESNFRPGEHCRLRTLI